MLVLAEGYTPTYARRVDPLVDTPTVTLETLAPPPTDPQRVAHGLIVDDRGTPVAGAVISAGSIHWDDGRGTFGAVDGLDSYAVSGADGTFYLSHAEAVDAIGVDIRSPGLAPKLLQLRTGATPNRITLDPGATVVGRLVDGDAGLPGVAIGLAQVDRSAGEFFGEFTIATDADGAFTFNNVPAGSEYVIYGKMASLAAHGAAGPQRIRVGKGTVDVGVLEVAAGHRVAGRVTTSDGSALPEGVRLLLSAELQWDSQTVVLADDGRFAFDAVPAGQFSLSLRVPGYRLSARNVSRRPSWPTSLEGVVDGDLDLHVELEPGAPERPAGGRELWMREAELRKQPLRGVVAEKQ